MKEKTHKSLLSKENIETLESFQNDVSGYFGKMIDYLDDFVDYGIRKGKFTEQEVREDLDIALWYAYAFNNTNTYENYYKTIEWMPDSEKNAKGCGTWFYRYCVALIHCGKLRRALSYAKKAVKEEPTYPWGWLELAKLLAHFKDTEGAFEAIEKGLELVPNNYEFIRLKCEISRGCNIEEMENHYIDAVSDEDYQTGQIVDRDKKVAISGILCNKRALNRIKKLFQVENWEADSPYCNFDFTLEGKKVNGVFRMNEAAVSKLDFKWLKGQKKDITEYYLQYDCDGELYDLNRVAFNRDCSLDLIYYDERQKQYFTIPIGRYEEDDEEIAKCRLYLQSWEGDKKIIRYVECWVDDDGVTKHKGIVGELGTFEHYPCEQPIDYDKFFTVFEAGYDYLGYERWMEYDYIHIVMQFPIKKKYVRIIDEKTIVFSQVGEEWYNDISKSLERELNGKCIGELSGLFIKKADDKRNFILSVYAKVVVEDLAIKTLKDVLFNSEFEDVDLNHLNISVMRILEDDYELVYSAIDNSHA